MDGEIKNDGDSNIDAIKNMTVQEAREFYRIRFWDKYNYDEFVDFTVAARAFDMTVNMGARQAGKIIQRALNELNNNLVVDGKIGKNRMGYSTQ